MKVPVIDEIDIPMAINLINRNKDNKFAAIVELMTLHGFDADTLNSEVYKKFNQLYFDLIQLQDDLGLRP